MKVHVADHPLIAHKLTVLRDEKTDSPTFRHLVEELVTLLSYEATREVKVVPKAIKTPVSPMTGVAMSKPTPVVVPVMTTVLFITIFSKNFCGFSNLFITHIINYLIVSNANR